VTVASDANCREALRSDARAFTEAEREGADRLLVIQTEIRQRWIKE
jgi:hypothetical protein